MEEYIKLSVARYEQLKHAEDIALEKVKESLSVVREIEAEMERVKNSKTVFFVKADNEFVKKEIAKYMEAKEKKKQRVETKQPNPETKNPNPETKKPWWKL